MIHSSEELKLRAKGRNLVSVDKASPALKSITSALKVIICLCRNLVLVALVSNSFNLWMPLLLFIESFLMVGMWTHDVHYITEMYTAIFSSKLDLINMLRMMFNGNPTSSKIEILNTYGYSNKFFANISGEFAVLLLLFIASVVIKVSNVFVKS